MFNDLIAIQNPGDIFSGGLIFILNLSCLVFVPDFDAADIGRCFLAIVYVAVGFGAFVTLRFVGIRFIVYLILVVMGTDVFALVFGVSLGKHKMAPKLSPKKSIEGAIGGVIGAALLGVLYAVLVNKFAKGADVTVWLYALICGVGALISQVGDLAASAIKRNFDIKDYGNLIPGHGGIMDRFDSVMITAPIIYYLAVYLL